MSNQSLLEFIKVDTQLDELQSLWLNIKNHINTKMRKTINFLVNIIYE